MPNEIQALPITYHERFRPNVLRLPLLVWDAERLTSLVNASRQTMQPSTPLPWIV